MSRSPFKDELVPDHLRPFETYPRRFHEGIMPLTRLRRSGVKGSRASKFTNKYLPSLPTYTEYNASSNADTRIPNTNFLHSPLINETINTSYNIQHNNLNIFTPRFLQIPHCSLFIHSNKPTDNPRTSNPSPKKTPQEKTKDKKTHPPIPPKQTLLYTAPTRLNFLGFFIHSFTFVGVGG